MHGVGITVTCGAIVGLGCVAWNRTSLSELGWTLREPARWIVHGLLMTALFVASTFGVYGMMAGKQGIVDLAAAISAMPSEDRSFFLVMGARNAFLEETLFRGSLLIALEKRWGSLVAILLSAAIHALHHRAFAPVPLLVKFTFAVVMATSVVRTRSLVPAAIAHALLWTIAGYA
jgi:membrane protease YdiL (CAAX protease family)